MDMMSNKTEPVTEILLSAEHKILLIVASANYRIIEQRLESLKNEVRAVKAENVACYQKILNEAKIDLDIYDPVDLLDGSCKFVLKEKKDGPTD